MNAPFLLPWLPEADGRHERYAYETSILTAHDGSETRAKVRQAGMREVQYRYRALEGRERLGHLEAWSVATEPLRVYLPLWFDAEWLPVDVGPAAVSVPVTPATRGYVDGGWALLRHTDTACELVSIATVGATDLMLNAPVVGTYPADKATIAPVIIAWMDPPSAQQYLPAGEDFDLTFYEETPVVGVDPALGAATAAVPASISIAIYNTTLGGDYTPQQYNLHATVKDAAGVVLPSVQVIWTSNPPVGGAVTLVTSLYSQRASLECPPTCGGGDLGITRASPAGFPAVTAEFYKWGFGTGWDH